MKSWRDVPGWWEDEWLFRDIVDAAPDPAHFVEVGSWMGRSTCCMIGLIRKSGKRIRLDCIDTWKGSDYGSHPSKVADLEAEGKTLFGEFVRNIQACGGNAICMPRICTSLRAAAIYADESLDCVFIDADHRDRAVEADCTMWWPNVVPGGMLCGHDWPATDEAPQGVKSGVLAAGLEPEHKGMVWWLRK